MFTGGFGAGTGRARRQLNVDDHVALVLHGYKRLRQAQIEVTEHRDNAHVHQHHPAGTRHQPVVQDRVTLGEPGKATVEGAEETAFLMVSLRNRLEQRGTQRRSERQRQEAREQNRHRQRHRELLVDHTHRAGHERQWHEHRRQHQGDADDRSRYLPHRFNCGIDR
ncbi:hypothetical protein D3C75_530480 [compost metagenome]